MFMQDIEEDPELRACVDLYKDKAIVDKVLEKADNLEALDP